MTAVAKVLPFRTNNYVIDNIINWDNIPDDPIFQLTFPQPEMLNDTDLQRVIKLMKEDADDLILLFKEIIDTGFHLTVMAHFTHPVEMDTPQAKEAVKRIISSGATIRCQSPVLRNINDNSDLWVEMWSKQVNMGMVPYYMFVARDTGPKGYFNLPLEEIYEIFNSAFGEQHMQLDNGISDDDFDDEYAFA